MADLSSDYTRARASWKHLPEHKDLTEEKLEAEVRKVGFDSVLLIRLVGVDEDEEYVKPRKYYKRAPKKHRYKNYYRYSYEIIEEPALLQDEQDLPSRVEPLSDQRRRARLVQPLEDREPRDGRGGRHLGQRGCHREAQRRGLGPIARAPGFNDKGRLPREPAFTVVTPWRSGLVADVGGHTDDRCVVVLLVRNELAGHRIGRRRA